MNKCRSEAPFVVVSCTARTPSGTSFGIESWNVTLPETGSFVLADETRATFAGKLVHNSSAPFRFSPKKVTTVVLPGDTAAGEASFKFGSLPKAAPDDKAAIVTRKNRFLTGRTSSHALTQRVKEN